MVDDPVHVASCVGVLKKDDKSRWVLDPLTANSARRRRNVKNKSYVGPDDDADLRIINSSTPE
jgi:hypothetical protein